MYKIPANTLFLGKQLVFVPECHSTNTLAVQFSQNPANAEGTTIITQHQTAGRGQHGNRWDAEPGMNLTFSVILKPAFLSVSDQFHLNIITSLAVRDYLVGKTDQLIHIKWPNDILVHEKKICGILIENQLQGQRFITVVVGIGLNINQTEFGTVNATSLKLLTGHEHPLEQQLHHLLECLETRFLQLRAGRTAELKRDYLRNLYLRNQAHVFSADAEKFEGRIEGVDERGRLVVETNSGRKTFGIKEISFE